MGSVEKVEKWVSEDVSETEIQLKVEDFLRYLVEKGPVIRRDVEVKTPPHRIRRGGLKRLAKFFARRELLRKGEDV